jgi:predicted nucleotidyltransferase
MRLTADEQTWLDAYCQVLKEQYPSIVERMVIYGSKARGDDHPDSDLDVLLIVKNEAAHLKRQLRVSVTNWRQRPTRCPLFWLIPRTSGKAAERAAHLSNKP